MLITGLVLFAVSLVVLLLCRPGANRELRRYLGGGLDIVAAIPITMGLGLAAVFFVAGLMA